MVLTLTNRWPYRSLYTSKSSRALALTSAALLVIWAGTPAAAEHTLYSFRRIDLTDVYYSEGANAGDFNNDGHVDAVYGPFWFAGPDFQQRHEIYEPKAQPREAYADNFFSWVYDFNRDGWNDVFVVGFPGTPAYVYQNPARDDADQHWEKHEVFDWVSNESPHFTDLVGDAQPELVCTRDGYFGYATFDPQVALGNLAFSYDFGTNRGNSFRSRTGCGRY